MQQPVILVPARLASTRFPRKLLHPILGKPLVLHVAERIRSVAPHFRLCFAVDSVEIDNLLSSNGYQTIQTDPAHISGTDRLAEANRLLKASHVINVQADEPLVTGGQIRALADLLAAGFPMATLAIRFRKPADFLNPNQVKVVFDNDRSALYFSRSPLPYPRDLRPEGVTESWLETTPCYRHLGLYAYSAELLEQFTRWPAGKLELIEKLEQLRVLENGHKIGIGLTEDATIGVDAPEDAPLLEAALKQQQP
jgi:3-deoxy-manno-octulosonate cytidylyltransferase (CMP-KDO synthetase)